MTAAMPSKVTNIIDQRFLEKNRGRFGKSPHFFAFFFVKPSLIQVNPIAIRTEKNSAMRPFWTTRAKPMMDAPTPQCQEGTVRLECFDSSYILFFRLGTPNLPTIITTVLGYYKGRGPITTVAIQMGSQGHGMSCISKM